MYIFFIGKRFKIKCDKSEKNHKMFDLQLKNKPILGLNSYQDKIFRYKTFTAQNNLIDS